MNTIKDFKSLNTDVLATVEGGVVDLFYMEQMAMVV